MRSPATPWWASPRCPRRGQPRCHVKDAAARRGSRVATDILTQLTEGNTFFDAVEHIG
jgi:hypothetical protein